MGYIFRSGESIRCMEAPDGRTVVEAAPHVILELDAKEQNQPRRKRQKSFQGNGSA